MADLDNLEPEGIESEQQLHDDADASNRRISAAEQKLRSEINTLKKQIREANAALLSSKYGVELSPDELKGVNVATLEGILSKVAAAVPPQTQQLPEAEEEQQAPAPDAATIAAVQQFISKGAASTMPAQAPKLSIAEARKIPWEERRKLIDAGRVEGVQPPPKR